MNFISIFYYERGERGLPYLIILLVHGQSTSAVTHRKCLSYVIFIHRCIHKDNFFKCAVLLLIFNVPVWTMNNLCLFSGSLPIVYTWHFGGNVPVLDWRINASYVWEVKKKTQIKIAKKCRWSGCPNWHKICCRQMFMYESYF